MENKNLDTIFSVLENPIRRKILAKLAKEQHYPLQLSKELNISQQAIMKHLKVLEDHNLVVSFEEKSTLGGPPRKCYVSNKHISLRVDIGPNTFFSEVYDYQELEGESTKKLDDESIGKDVKEDKAQISRIPETVQIDEITKKEKKDERFENLIQRFNDCQAIKEPNEKLTELSNIIQDINQELEDLKLKRVKLLNIRERVVEESNRIIGELCREYDERKIMYYFITHKNHDIATISEALEIREKVIMDIFKQLFKQRILLDFDDDIINE